MRFILFILLVTGCSRTATPVVPIATPATTTAVATCGFDEPSLVEIKVEVEVEKPAKSVFDREACH